MERPDRRPFNLGVSDIGSTFLDPARRRPEARLSDPRALSRRPHCAHFPESETASSGLGR